MRLTTPNTTFWSLEPTLVSLLVEGYGKSALLCSNASEINTLEARMMGQAYNPNNWEVVQGHQEEFKVFFAMECV